MISWLSAQFGNTRRIAALVGRLTRGHLLDTTAQEACATFGPNHTHGGTDMGEADAFYFALGIVAGAALFWIVVSSIRYKR